MLRLAAKTQTDLSLEYPFLAEWTIRYDQAKKRAGACQFNLKQILISRQHVKLNTESIVRDTLLHEFAHAIAYQLYGDSGHGACWKSVAVKLGVTPKARGTFNLPKAPWQLVFCCQVNRSLEKVTSRYRRNKQIQHYSIKGRPETQGQLYYLSTTELELYESGQLSFEQLNLQQ